MSERSQFRLLAERRFLPFFLTQFFGAANDNVFKFAFTVLATYSAAQWGGMDPKSAGAVIGGIFILPFVLFSATAGQLADRFEKGALIRFVKNLEIAIMLAIAAGFVWQIVALLFAGVFLMGLHSTLFGPVKYAYLPQHLGEEELTGGNGMVEMARSSRSSSAHRRRRARRRFPGSGPHWWQACPIALAWSGAVAAGFVRFASVRPRPAHQLESDHRNLGQHRTRAHQSAVFRSMLGISWLWFFGSIFLTTFLGLPKKRWAAIRTCRDTAACSVSRSASAWVAALRAPLRPQGRDRPGAVRLDRHDAVRGRPVARERRLTPAGLAGIGAFLADHGNWRVMADLFLLALFAGFYSVPLYALIQSRCEPSHRARIIAANNILNALFMVVASLMAALLLHAGCRCRSSISWSGC
jgi:MFS family permease